MQFAGTNLTVPSKDPLWKFPDNMKKLTEKVDVGTKPVGPSNEAVFNTAVPSDLKHQPLKDSETADPLPPLGAFDQLLPECLKGDCNKKELDEMSEEEPVKDVAQLAKDVVSEAKGTFPIPTELKTLDVDNAFDIGSATSAADFPNDTDNEFDFNSITAGVSGVDELLNGRGRRLQADDVSDVASILFGSNNLAL